MSGGHGYGVLDKGGGKHRHTEFPASWTKETVREAYYQVMRNAPIIGENLLRFIGAYRGVLLKVEYSLSGGVGGMDVHLYPVKGP